MSADFLISGGGTLYILTPITDAARGWVDEHLPEDAQTLGRGVAIEHRYIGPIVQALVNDGLTIGGHNG